MLDFSKITGKITERFDRLTNGELQEIVDLIGKGEKIDAWIKLGISSEQFKEQKEEMRRVHLKNTIINELFSELS